MFGNCVCPPGDAIVDIPDNDCGFSLLQVQKIIVARRSNSAFATLLLPQVLANWTTLLTATDDTKAQITPFVEEFKIPQADPILQGGDDNTTIDGAPIPVGAAQIRAEGKFPEIASTVLEALKAFNCERDLMVYLVNQNSMIYGINPTGTVFTGIPIRAWFVGDAGNDGLNTRDKAPIGFNLRYNWRNKLVGIIPTDFDPLLDL